MEKKLSIAVVATAAVILLVTVLLIYNLYIKNGAAGNVNPGDSPGIEISAADEPEPPAATAAPEPAPSPPPEPPPEPATVKTSGPAPAPTFTPSPSLSPSPTPAQTPTPTPSPRVINPRFHDLLEKNKDVVGWIYIENTHIDYPVLYDGTNDYYLYHDVDGNNTTAASIFMDASNGVRRDNYNTLLHGHNMKNGTMFADISKYKNGPYFWDPKHSIIYFDTLYDDMVWEVFSVYVVNADNEFIYTNFMSPEAFLSMAQSWQERSLHSIDGLELVESDRILTLNTCSYETDNSRTILHARLIYKNGAKTAEPHTGFLLDGAEDH